MRIARDLGDVSLILPDGCDRLLDAPAAFTYAVKGALQFLSFEEMMPDDVPPRKLWTDPVRLRDWFDDLRSKHRGGSRADEIDEPVRNGAMDMLFK